MIRVDTIWLATAPLDMRAGADTVGVRVISMLIVPEIFGSAAAMRRLSLARSHPSPRLSLMAVPQPKQKFMSG